MKINFTQAHETELKALFLELGFSGEVLTGKFGANAYTVWDCIHNLQTNTLKELNKSLKKEIAALEDVDEWSTTNKQQIKADKMRKWQQFVSLCTGYRLFKEEEVEEAKKLRAEKAEKLALLKHVKSETEINELKKLSSEELQKQIDAIING